LDVVQREHWFGVELRHLAALSAVAREGSFRRAAEELGYVQSAVSQQVAQLERLVGVRLVERFRGSRDVHLTDAGELLLAHAEEILARLDAARADLTAHTEGGHAGVLRVGAAQRAAAGLLPRIMRRLAQVAPELTVVPVEVGADEDLFALVEQGLVDLAFGDLPLEPGPFESVLILCDPCLLLVPAGSSLADGEEPPSLEALAKMPLIAPARARWSASLESWFTAHGLTPNFGPTAETEATTRAFVEAGLGVAIMPRLAVGSTDGSAAAIDLADVVPARRLGLFWHSERHRASGFETFREVAAKVGLELTAPCSPAPVPPIDLIAA